MVAAPSISIPTNPSDTIGWFEWSAEPDSPITLPSGEINWPAFAQANPSLGTLMHPDNLKAVINDPPDIVKTEVLCLWVDTINSAIDAQKWELCKSDPIIIVKNINGGAVKIYPINTDNLINGGSDYNLQHQHCVWFVAYKGNWQVLNTVNTGGG